jgi:hypothetical protein
MVGQTASYDFVSSTFRSNTTNRLSQQQIAAQAAPQKQHELDVRKTNRRFVHQKKKQQKIAAHAAPQKRYEP